MRRIVVLLFALVVALMAASAWALAAEGEPVWEDSFETTEPNAHPVGWTTRYSSDHAPDTGPRVVDASVVAAPHGSQSLRLVDRQPGISAIANKDFAPLTKGRLVADVMVPGENGGFLNVEIRIGGNRVFGVDMHRSNGVWRWRDEGDQLNASTVEFEYDRWYTLVIEWDAAARIYHAFVLQDDGSLVRFTPDEGGKFNVLRLGTPSRLELRVGSSTNTDLQIGYVDNIRLYAID